MPCGAEVPGKIRNRGGCFDAVETRGHSWMEGSGGSGRKTGARMARVCETDVVMGTIEEAGCTTGTCDKSAPLAGIVNGGCTAGICDADCTAGIRGTDCKFGIRGTDCTTGISDTSCAAGIRGTG